MDDLDLLRAASLASAVNHVNHVNHAKIPMQLFVSVTPTARSPLGCDVPGVDLLEDGLSTARRVGERWLLATSKRNLWLAYLCVGNTDRARAGFGEALRAYEEIGDQRFHARCLAYLGHVGRYRFRCPPQQHGRPQGQEHGT